MVLPIKSLGLHLETLKLQPNYASIPEGDTGTRVLAIQGLPCVLRLGTTLGAVFGHLVVIHFGFDVDL